MSAVTVAPHVDGDRLRADIERTAEFGDVDADRGRGRTVLTGSEADGRAREYLVERLEAAGLDVRVDPVGNVAGRWTPDGADHGAEPVASGSHLDSVPEGGIFDGPLGVYAALEAVRALQASPVSPARPVEVVSFTEEEGGRFGVGTLGSSVATGDMSVDSALDLADPDDVTLADYLDRVGFRGEADLAPGEWDSWLELHIEQGTKLESAGAPVAAVDSIAGITNCRVEIAGETDHAGSTPMAERTDALAAASAYVLAVESVAADLAAEGHPTVATVGELSVSPGARNVIPGLVELSMDVRDVDADRIDAVVDRCRDRLADIAADRGVEATLDRYRDRPPIHLSDRCVAAVETGADRAGVTDLRMPSAAIHDTANVAEVTDAAMLFAPSEDGRSHTPLEWTDWDDCATATRVLAEAIADLAS